MAGQPRRMASNPPIVRYPELSKSLTAAEAQPLLADFLEKSRKAPHLHPDAWLYSNGVKFGPKAGSSGGWAMHHLRRIEAGLRGERLAAESKEELAAKFGDDAFEHADTVADTTVPEEGDDTRVDKVIEERQSHDEKKRRKQEKKERTEREKARKRRKVEDRNEAASGGADASYQDSMSENIGEWQKAQDYEEEQTMLEGDVASRDPADGRQVTSPPVVVAHDTDGEIVVPKAKQTPEEKAARKAAKKARKEKRKAAEAG